jgi:hypothetical protein
MAGKNKKNSNFAVKINIFKMKFTFPKQIWNVCKSKKPLISQIDTNLFVKISVIRGKK